MVLDGIAARRRLTRGVRGALLGAVVLTLAACGATAGTATSSSRPRSASAGAVAATGGARALRPVTLQLAWTVSGYHAPLMLALERGYYRQAGLDVKVAQGHGGNLAVDAVAKGGPVFSTLSVSAAMLPISQGAPVKVIAVYDHESPSAVFYHAATPMSSPQDLIGKTVIYQASAVSFQMLPAVLAVNHMSMSQLDLHNVSSQEFPALFAKSPKTVVIGFINSDYLRVLAANPDARYKLYADWGVNLYDMGLVTNDAMIRQHPNEVRAFVAATTRGWQAALADPQAAVAATVKEFPDASPSVIAQGVKLTLGLLDTPAGHPMGWMSNSAWQAQLALLRKYAGMKGDQPTSDFYTNRFVGAAA